MAKNPRIDFAALGADTAAPDAKTVGMQQRPATSTNPLARPMERTASTVAALERRPNQTRAGSVISADTARCRMWRYADRNDEGMSTALIDCLSESIGQFGQITPCIARRVFDAEGVDFEIVAGHRRFDACKHGGQNIKLMVKEMTDAEAYVVMTIENEDREGISPFSRALSLKAALDSNLYPSQQSLIDEFNATAAGKILSKSYMSKMVKAARIAAIPELWGAVRNPSTIEIKSALALVEMIDSAPTVTLAAIKSVIADLGAGGTLAQIDGRELVKFILKRLTTSGAATKVQVEQDDCVITAQTKNGKISIEISHRKGAFPARESVLEGIALLLDSPDIL